VAAPHAARTTRQHQQASPLVFSPPKKGTGPELWEQMGGDIDAFVCGVGSGGTMGGVGGYLRGKNPDVALVLADPVGSILAPLTRGERVKPGSWMVEGIGARGAGGAAVRLLCAVSCCVCMCCGAWLLRVARPPPSIKQTNKIHTQGRTLSLP
jgi:cysteine synthase